MIKLTPLESQYYQQMIQDDNTEELKRLDNILKHYE